MNKKLTLLLLLLTLPLGGQINSALTMSVSVTTVVKVTVFLPLYPGPRKFLLQSSADFIDWQTITKLYPGTNVILQPIVEHQFYRIAVTKAF